MSLLTVLPDLLQSAAADLVSIGWELNAARTAAAVWTTGPVAARADEVSAAVAAHFARHPTGITGVVYGSGVLMVCCTSQTTVNFGNGIVSARRALTSPF